MKYLFIFSLSLFSCFSLASDLAKAPLQPDADHVFIDIKDAVYSITYDFSTQTTSVVSTLRFMTEKDGFALLDLVPLVESVVVDGITTTFKALSLDGVTTMLQIDTPLKTGEHQLIVKHKLSKHEEYGTEGVASAFWFNDLMDRGFLENYLPSNLEYDQYSMTLNIEFVGGSAQQKIMSNGKITQISSNQYQIQFPAYYTSSSAFYHTFPADSFVIQETKFKSINGTEIPVTIYGHQPSELSLAETSALSVFNELENDYGPWAHDKIIIYLGMLGGGMEYCGATVTDLSSLPHELTHSYFARGMMPANGNAGWIDEAIASWRDDHYLSTDQLSHPRNMAGRSPYIRQTSLHAYWEGKEFVGHLDFLTKNKSGLKPFLKHLYATKKFEPISTEEFRSLLENYFSENFQSLFETYVYDKTAYQTHKLSQDLKRQNPHHRAYSNNELRGLLK